MKFDFSKVFEVSFRVAFAAFVACIVFLFFPSKWLPFDITPYRVQFGFLLFLAFVISAAILVSYFAKWIVTKIQGYIKNRNTWNSYKYVLSNLSDTERAYLKELYEKRESAIMLNLSDPITKKLETFKVLSMAAGTNIAPRGYCPGFVQPWVFELIDKHPEYLSTKNGKQA